MIDLAIISLGAITVPGYTTSNEEEISYLLSHSKTSIIFINSKLLSLIEKILPTLNNIKYVICVDEIKKSKKFKFKQNFYTYNDLIRLGLKIKNKQKNNYKIMNIKDLKEVSSEDLRQELELRGWYTQNLWHVDDVMQNYDCTSEYAMRLLDYALTSESIIEEVYQDIDVLMQQHKRKR